VTNLMVSATNLRMVVRAVKLKYVT